MGGWSSGSSKSITQWPVGHRLLKTGLVYKKKRKYNLLNHIKFVTVHLNHGRTSWTPNYFHHTENLGKNWAVNNADSILNKEILIIIFHLKTLLVEEL